MRKFLQEFKEFAMRGNVMDLAVGVIIGAAFQTIINSLVNDIIMPLIGLIGKVDFSQKVFAPPGRRYPLRCLSHSYFEFRDHGLCYLSFSQSNERPFQSGSEKRRAGSTYN